MWDQLLHWGPIVAGILLMVANALLRHYDGKNGFTKFLHVLVDILSPFTRKDSPGTLKIPGTKSANPPITIELPDEVAEDLLRMIDEKKEAAAKPKLPVLMLLSVLLFSGCASFKNTLHKSISITASSGIVAHQAALKMCTPVLEVCIAQQKNPCPALEACQAARARVLWSLQRLQETLAVALKASDADDVKGADEAISFALGLLADVRILLSGYGLTI